MTSPAGTTARDVLALAAAAGLLLLSGGGRSSDSAPQPEASPARPPGTSSVPEPQASSPSRAPLDAAGRADPSTGADDLEEGRRILARHCGSCHTPGLPTTKAAALAIFSLADADWTTHMTPKQICASSRRIHGTSHEPEEVRAYTELATRLLARRGAPPCGS